MSSDAQDISLWERVTSGSDPESFGMLYQRYVPVLFAAVSKHIGHKADVEEIVQETFMELWENRFKINIRSSFFSYLYSMARYKTWKHLKSVDYLSKHQEQWSAFIDAKEELAGIDPGSTAAEFVKAEQRLEQTIASLPERMQALFRLKFEEKLSNSEIAERMNLSRHTVKKQLTGIGNMIKRTVVQFLFAW